VALNTINQTKPRWHLFICQSTEHNYTFHALPPNKSIFLEQKPHVSCEVLPSLCVCEHFTLLFCLRLHGQLVPNIAWMMLRSYSIKIPHFVLMGQKNIAYKGILVSDRPVYKKISSPLKLLCQSDQTLYYVLKVLHKNSSFHFDQTKNMTDTMYKNMSMCFCGLKSGLTKQVQLDCNRKPEAPRSL